MSPRIATTFAVVLASVVAAMTTAQAGPCAPKRSSPCDGTSAGVDLNSVSDIADRIVGQEPTGRKSEPAGPGAADPAPYTGPLIGVAPGTRAPTIGYSWSLH